VHNFQQCGSLIVKKKLASTLDYSSEVNSADTVLFGTQSENLKRPDSVFLPSAKSERYRIRALRQTH
jgi:hypothetical protein